MELLNFKVIDLDATVKTQDGQDWKYPELVRLFDIVFEEEKWWQPVNRYFHFYTAREVLSETRSDLDQYLIKNYGVESGETIIFLT